MIEPLSLDEAYLDGTENKTGLPTATCVARTIREQIHEELHLTASAGVAAGLGGSFINVYQSGSIALVKG